MRGDYDYVSPYLSLAEKDWIMEMNKNYDDALRAVLAHEGGFVNHPNDTGGATNMGITIGVLSEWLGRKATISDVRSMSLETAKAIYKKNYWDKIKGDDLPSGVDYAVFDFAVNSGVSRASKYLQSIAVVTQDGIIGPQTLYVLQNMKPSLVIKSLCEKRLKFVQGINTFPTFGKGWTSRIKAVEQRALSMVYEVERPHPQSNVKPLPVGNSADVSAIAIIFAFVGAIFGIVAKVLGLY